MKPKRFYFRSTPLFGTPLRYGAPVFAGLAVILTGLDADARDILRANASAAGAAPAAASGGAALTRAATDAARANCPDMLRRTSRTLDAMRAMQNAARAAAQSGPDNLGPPSTCPMFLTDSAPADSTPADAATNPPMDRCRPAHPDRQTARTKVTIKQTAQQALLNWETFNVGKKTTLTFDQSNGGENVGQWIAFNKVSDPSANPTQILGNIKADGQVYIINPNGIIFGGSSQVNARGLTVSSLPINDNLVDAGPAQQPRRAVPLLRPRSSPAVRTARRISIPKHLHLHRQIRRCHRAGRGHPQKSGQQRRQWRSASCSSARTSPTRERSPPNPARRFSPPDCRSAMAAHDGNDPSLRGLDVWVGEVGDYAGAVNQTGLIESLTGSTSMTGRSSINSGSSRAAPR